MKFAIAILLATPELLLAVVLLILAVETRYLPAGGMHSPGWEGMDTAARFRDTLRHLRARLRRLSPTVAVRDRGGRHAADRGRGR